MLEKFFIEIFKSTIVSYCRDAVRWVIRKVKKNLFRKSQITDNQMKIAPKSLQKESVLNTVTYSASHTCFDKNVTLNLLFIKIQYKETGYIDMKTS